MVIVDVVLETYDAVDFTAWPIAEPSSDRLLALSGRMSSVDVGTAMAVIFSYNKIPVTHAADLTEAHLDQHLAEAEALIAPGGLRFRDTTTDVSIAPGCCFGLENWRDWWDVTRGQEPWLGHDPTPHITHLGQVIRLQQDDGDSPSVEITRGELAGLLTTAQQHFSGFLDLARPWATRTTPGLADQLITALDQYFMITVTE
ncbi:hypothetical protein LDL08_28165 [Nonomuraea glycinis]|uniref:Uncharacterized protein n=1 Tax=Nonomuraea glycinis TaxID=2047744 RepID=A0A918E7I3_9ACTN|nr:hypothetical protein [Nonomuraea glycinis]MCA2180063.1 hypothetical protein [Nonomuraea glycinis]GGP10805.1 hypothetical protein GCM10012278_51920 [Nonomuraea glycinis]